MIPNNSIAETVSHIDEIRYELTESEVLELYYSEPRLAALMEIDIIKWIEHHLVVNLKEFITPKTHKLTARAKRNPSSCCVGVQYKQQCDEVDHLLCTLDILIQSASFLEGSDSVDGEQTDEEQRKESSIIDTEIARINGILNELPGSFSGSLKYHMAKKGYTEELLAEEADVSVSTVKQYRQNEDKKKKIKTVIALCIGMHLHPWLTEDLLRKAGLTWTATKMDGALRFLYTFHYKDTIDECNKYLRSQGLPEFKQREKSA